MGLRKLFAGLTAALAIAVGGTVATNALAATIALAPLLAAPEDTLSPCYGSASLTFDKAPIVAGISPVYRVHDSVGVICAWSSPIQTQCFTTVYDLLGAPVGSSFTEGTNGCTADHITSSTYPIGYYVRQSFGVTLTLTYPGSTWPSAGNGFCTNSGNVANCTGQQEGIAPSKHHTTFG
jgi:hypothetical protein